MDLNIDFKNLKIEDIKEKLLKLADKKTLIKIGIGAGAVIIFLIIYYAVLNPIVKKKKIQLDDMNKKKQETTELIQKIKSKQKKINKLKPRYEEYSTLFHSKAEVEGLYNTLSVFAGENDLVISKIEKKEIKLGIDVLKKTNSYDHIQALVVRNKKVIAIEKSSGTHAMLSSIKKTKNKKE